MKLLFLCSRNKQRSLTAERLFDGWDGHQARSAGTEEGARIRVTAGHLGWADVVLVMEKKHLRRIQAKFADALRGKRVVCLHVPDHYGFMDEALVERLEAEVPPHLSEEG